MKKVIYTFVELEDWNKNSKCVFCSNFDITPIKATKQIKIRNTETNKLIGGHNICDSCREKFDNNQIEKCDKCGKLFRNSIDFDFWQRRYICKCGTRKQEEEEEIEPERYSTKLEKELHNLSLEKSQVEEELETEREAHLAGVEASGDWYRRKYEVEKEEIEEKRRRLSSENKRLKTKIVELEKALSKYQSEREHLKETINNLDSQNLEREVKLESITTQTFDILDISPRQEAYLEIPPK